MARNFPSQSRSVREEAAEYPLKGCSVSGVVARSRRQERTSRDSRTPARMHFLRWEDSHGNDHFGGTSIIERAVIPRDRSGRERASLRSDAAQARTLAPTLGGVGLADRK